MRPPIRVRQRAFRAALVTTVVLGTVLSLPIPTMLAGDDIAWVSPEADATVAGLITLTVRAPEQTASVSFFTEDGTWLGRDTSGPPWNLDFDTTRFPDGPRSFRATARLEDGTFLDTEKITVWLANGTAGPMPTPSPAPSVGTLEVTTGLRLGEGYNARWFYVRRGTGDWEPTYADANAAAHGKLMNFRASRAVTNNDELPDDIEQPEANTDAVIANLDAYRAHGILMLTVGLQTHRVDGYGSAFNPDGSLKPDWLGRLGRLIEAASTRGMIIQTYLFFQGHDEDFTDDEAIRRGVRDYTDWLIAHDYRNVIIEIANEYNHGGFDSSLIQTDEGIASLVELAQSRFVGREWRALVTASRGGCACWPSGRLREVADVATIHGNSTSVTDKRERTAALVADENIRGPVVMNEDDNLEPGLEDPFDQAALQREQETASGIFAAGASWGMMVVPWNQREPYQWELGDEPGINGTGEERERNYVHAVFDHIQHLVGLP